MTDDRSRERETGAGTDTGESGTGGSAADRFIDPEWPEEAQRIIADKHATSARLPLEEPPDTGSEGGAAEEDGPGRHASPDNLNVEHENQARWREIKM